MKINFISGKWHAWDAANGCVLLSDESRKMLKQFADVDACINWLFISGEKVAARALNEHKKAMSTPKCVATVVELTDAPETREVHFNVNIHPQQTVLFSAWGRKGMLQLCEENNAEFAYLATAPIDRVMAATCEAIAANFDECRYTPLEFLFDPEGEPGQRFYFEFEGERICHPRESECGRFPCDASYYGLTEQEAHRLDKLNYDDLNTTILALELHNPVQDAPVDDDDISTYRMLAGDISQRPSIDNFKFWLANGYCE